jgi:HemY protein
MLRALKFIVVALILLGIAWWIGTLPGTLTAASGPYTVETSVPAALLILFLIAVLFTVILRVIGGVRRAPGGIGAWRGGRRRQQGEAAIQRGMVALAAGDAPAARAAGATARKTLGDHPMALFLAAESARLAGFEAEAKSAFTKLTAHRHMAFLGHHGLLQQSFAAGDHEAASVHADAAEAAYPGSPWLKNKRLELAVRRRQFGTAMSLTADRRQTAALSVEEARATADPRRALSLAKRAVKADPTLAPAVVVLANALRAAGKPRAARKTLLAGWKAAPHPMIAAAFLEPVATPIERAQAASELAAQAPGTVESELALAQTALAALLTGEARRHAQTVIASGEDDGRAAAILQELDGQPVAAVIPTRWVCDACHHAAPDWSAACPNCHKIGSLVWRRPGTALA